MSKLTPPDLERCQAEKPNGHTFLTLGGSPGRVRCDSRPVFVAKELHPGEDGQCGSMSLCAKCQVVFVKQLGIDYAEFERIGG
jgi:hypothetical protein